MPSPRRAMPNLAQVDLEAGRTFWCDVLGFEVGMEQPGMRMLRSPDTPTTQVLLHQTGATDAMDPAVEQVALSVEVEDVDAVHAAALERGLEIVYELRDEPWGVRRFFVRDPGGHVVNVAQHIAQ